MEFNNGMYHTAFGVRRETMELLGILGLKHFNIPRFRDCYLDKDGKSIIVYTRSGGANRKEYKEGIKELKKSPYYITDYDDTFDETYMSFKFKVPNAYAERVSEIFKHADTMTGQEKWDHLFKVMEDPDADKFKNEFPELFKQTQAMFSAMESGNVEKQHFGGMTLVNVTPGKDK